MESGGLIARDEGLILVTSVSSSVLYCCHVSGKTLCNANAGFDRRCINKSYYSVIIRPPPPTDQPSVNSSGCCDIVLLMRTVALIYVVFNHHIWLIHHMYNEWLTVHYLYSHINCNKCFNACCHMQIHGAQLGFCGVLKRLLALGARDGKRKRPHKLAERWSLLYYRRMRWAEQTSFMWECHY